MSNNSTTGDGEAAGDISGIEFSRHKHLQHAARLETLAGGGDVFPVTVELDPVSYCNHRCPWCVDPEHGDATLELDAARVVLAELAALGVRGVVFKGGGEPTLHPQFVELLAAAVKLELEVGIVTNGSRLSRLAGPVAALASYVRISIDGPSAFSHARVHRSDDFERVVQGARELVMARRAAGRRHPITGASFAMDHDHLELVPRAVELGADLGLHYVLFRTPFFEEVGREPSMTLAQTAAVREAFHRAQRAHQGPMRVMVDHWVSDSEAAAGATSGGAQSPRRGSVGARSANGIEHLTGRCLASPLMAVIAADRRVYPCCNLRALPDWCIGRLDHDRGVDLATVWASARRREVLERIHHFECRRWCTHPLSKYNEAIEYLAGPRYHGGFV